MKKIIENEIREKEEKIKAKTKENTFFLFVSIDW